MLHVGFQSFLRCLLSVMCANGSGLDFTWILVATPGEYAAISTRVFSDPERSLTLDPTCLCFVFGLTSENFVYVHLLDH